MATLKEVFQQTVIAELAKSNGTKWGADESVAVILALITDNIGSDDMAKDKDFVDAIKKVVNPSQYAQELEKTKGPDGQILLKRVGRGERTKSALMDFGTKA